MDLHVGDKVIVHDRIKYIFFYKYTDEMIEYLNNDSNNYLINNLKSKLYFHEKNQPYQTRSNNDIFVYKIFDNIIILYFIENNNKYYTYINERIANRLKPDMKYRRINNINKLLDI